MAPELRKRKAAPPAPEPVAKKPAKSKVAKTVEKVKETVTSKKAAAAPKTTKAANGSAAVPPAPVDAPSPAAASAGGKPVVGEVINLEGFGGEIETNDGTKTTLKALVEESKAGVVLFTYPKASTPGCTNQACLFRDSYEPLTAGGLSIYGLSTDSPKANTTFKEKQSLPYPLLCDPAATLIGAIGLKKSPKGTQRGVFVVDKAGKVVLAEPGSPAGTVDAVKKVVAALSAAGDGEAASKVEEKVEEEVAKD
ncbi:thioredoxin-like protein [Coniochaeta sp. 2T2.1]|nr:thioredoxin-like protein [Coniochaeta sp. 2T2.1]